MHNMLAYVLPFFYFAPIFLGKGILIFYIIAAFAYIVSHRVKFNDIFIFSHKFKYIYIFWGLLFITVTFSTHCAGVSFFRSDGPTFMFVLSLLFIAGKISAQILPDDINKYYKNVFWAALVSLIILLVLLWLNRKCGIDSIGDINALFCTMTNMQLIIFSYLILDFTHTNRYRLLIITALAISYVMMCSLLTSDVRYILLPLSIIILSIFVNSDYLYKVITITMAPLTIIMLFILKNTHLPKFINFAINTPIQKFFAGRDVIWTIATKGFLESPFYGNGPKTFPLYFEKNVQLIFPNHERLFMGIHSLPLYVLYSYGIIGFMCIMTLLFLYLQYTSNALKDKRLIGQVLIVISSWLPVFTYGIIDYASFIDSQMGLLILSLGILEGLILKLQKNN